MPQVKDHGWANVQAAVQAAAGGGRVKVGIQGEAAAAPKRGDDSDTAPLSVVEVAALHEYGIGVPQRSFLGDTFDGARPELDDVSRRVANGVLAGRFTVGRALALLGTHHQTQIKRRIRSGIAPENSEATKARKGSSTPLIDTGQMISAITYEVEG